MVGPTLEQSIPEGWHPVESTHAGAVLEELWTMGRAYTAEGHEGLYPMGRDPTLEQGKKMGEKEQQRWCNEPFAMPIP